MRSAIFIVRIDFGRKERYLLMPALQYDGLITIATGSSRRSASWKTKEMLWSEFVDKLGRVTRTQETQQEYFRMPKEERDNAKDVGGFVGGTLKGGRRKIDAVLQRRLTSSDLSRHSINLL